MAAYKVINLDNPIESDYWVDIPVRDPATNKDAVDKKGRILVERHVTRSVKNKEMSTINAAVETVNTLKEDYSTFKGNVSTKIDKHDSSILTNTNHITTLTDSVNNHDLQIHALYSKINAIQGIDIDDFKYVTETDIKNIKKNYLPLAGGTITGDLVLSGKVSSNSPIKANLQGTADRAIGDINGKALTSYITNLEVSGASVTVTNGAGETSNYTVDNVNHAANATYATSAGSATNAFNCTNKVYSSLTTNTYLSGNQGNVLVNSTASAGAYTMLTKLNSTNGKFTQGCYQNDYLLQYTTNATVNAGTNSVTKSVTLLNENGDSTFCGTVTAPMFKGALSGNATSATTATNANHATNADNATNANHATTADTANRAYPRNANGGNINFHWDGKTGQPTWLWGGEDGTNMYVYNPAAFSVNHASEANNATNAYNLRATSHNDHFIRSEWDGSYFWTWVRAPDGGTRNIRVAKATNADHATNANHATSADNATHATKADTATKATSADHATVADRLAGNSGGSNVLGFLNYTKGVGVRKSWNAGENPFDTFTIPISGFFYGELTHSGDTAWINYNGVQIVGPLIPSKSYVWQHDNLIIVVKKGDVLSFGGSSSTSSYLFSGTIIPFR